MEISVADIEISKAPKSPEGSLEISLEEEEIEKISIDNEIQSIEFIDAGDIRENESHMKSNKVFVIDLSNINEEDSNRKHASAGLQLQTSTSSSAFFLQEYDFFNDILSFKLEPFYHFYGAFGVTIIVSISVLTLILTCWPQHNLILNPEYWYEQIIPTSITWVLSVASCVIIDAQMLLKAKKILTLSVFWLYHFLRVLGNVMITALTYFFWVRYLELPPPMPHNTAVAALINAFVIAPLANWIIFPPELKTEDHPFRKKIFSFIAFNWLRMLMVAGYKFIPSLSIIQEAHLQWSLGLLFPMMEKFNMWWTSKFIRMAFDCDEEVATFESAIYVQILHAFTLTVVLGSSDISPWATYSLILADTLINVCSVRNIIRNHHQDTNQSIFIRDSSLKLLALKEFLEVLGPAVYCLSFTGSYMGPNYEILGSIGSDLWHHKKISSLYGKLEEVLIFMIAESIRGATFAIILWKFYGLSMYSAYCDVIRNYGTFILTLGALINITVNSCYLLS